jgi:hypothetical protein
VLAIITVLTPVLKQPDKRKGGDGRLDQHMGLRRQGPVERRQPLPGQVKIPQALVRRLFIPVATGERVRVQIDPDNLPIPSTKRDCSAKLRYPRKRSFRYHTSIRGVDP